MTTTPMASIGVDIGKAVFHVVGFGSDGKIAFRRKIKRLALLEAFKLPPPSIVGMEACLSAHFVSRALRQLGHQPRLIPAIYVKPFMKGFPVGSPSSGAPRYRWDRDRRRLAAKPRIRTAPCDLRSLVH